MSGRKRSRFWVGIALISVLGVYLALDSRLVTGEDAYAGANKAIDEWGKTYNLLLNEYFKELEPEGLSKASIRGMLEGLDPYTSFYDRRDLSQLRIETQGKFGGLGITISKREEGQPPTVMSVFKNTPADTAGLIVGDRIVKIKTDSSFSTHRMSLSEIVDVLRGRPGEGVTITIERPGLADWFEQPIVRARIDIESVQVPGITDPEIAYISMSSYNQGRFTERTPRELKQALEEAVERGAKGLILDLRGNPGGLLNSAVDVVDMFLDPGRVVVSTKGRRREQTREHKTETPAVVTDLPLVVLVNGRSASASEIVAGAIQDHDRGLILGTQTFGKGSVQTVRTIGPDKALKLTTALYYTPSERSIHRSSNRRRRTGLELTVSDSVRVSAYQLMGLIGEADRREDVITDLEEQFGLGRDQAEEVLNTRLDDLVGLGNREEISRPEGSDPEEVFKTTGGRTVYGGGGITPDVSVELERPSRVVLELGRRRNLYFDFVVQYAANKTFPETYEAWEMTDEVLAAFKIFLADSTNTKGFHYMPVAGIQLQELEKTLKAAEMGGSDSLALEQLRKLVDNQRGADFEAGKKQIMQEIEIELVNRVWGTKAKILASLKSDKQYQEAIQILKDPEIYREKMKLELASAKD